MNSETPQQLPGSGPERELLREKGQFWTPDWVADAMLAYVAQNDTDHVFDPAVGAGAFFRATHRLCAETGRQLQLLGTEIDREALGEAVATGLSDADLKNVRIANFLLDPPTRLFKAIVGNPPYIRHHRLPSEYKIELKKLGEGTIGTPIDGRAGLHVYFLIRALTLLEPGGRLAFIMPADTCEGIFAKSLWRWITKNYALNAVITFDRFAAPFPKVDVNAIIFLIAKGTSSQTTSNGLNVNDPPRWS